MTDSAEIWNNVWERVRNGRHTLVAGAHTTPTSASDLKLFRVDCGPPWTTRGPLLEVCATLEELLGEQEDPLLGSTESVGLWERQPLSKAESVFVEIRSHRLRNVPRERLIKRAGFGSPPPADPWQGIPTKGRGNRDAPKIFGETNRRQSPTSPLP